MGKKKTKNKPKKAKKRKNNRKRKLFQQPKRSVQEIERRREKMRLQQEADFSVVMNLMTAMATKKKDS